MNAVPQSCKVATPFPLARAMVQALGVRPRESWLDPCVGRGVFARSLQSAGVPAERIVALDLETEPCVDKDLAQVIWGQDYLAWAQVTPERFDNIIGNPPYLAISRLPDTLRRAALRVMAPGGDTMPRRANYWYAFLCASLQLLHHGGSLCFVLPSAWDYADYAKPVRSFVPGLFRVFHVHRCKKPLFDSVLDGCLVIVGRGFRQEPRENLRFSYDSANDLLNGLEADGPASDEAAAAKSRLGKPRRKVSGRRQQLLGELIDIRLGGVTGDARYFLLKESQRKKLGLPRDCLLPALSRARHLVASEMTESLWQSLREAGERVWLFHPSDEHLDHPAVRRYLDLKEEEGGCRRTRYKIKSRDPWYRTRLPEPIDGFVSGMTQFGPWLCFSRMPGLSATNTLYTFKFKETLSHEEKFAWALALRKTQRAEACGVFARKYADGLVKYEPGDLYKIPLELPKTIEGSSVRYRQSVEKMLALSSNVLAAGHV